MVSGSDQIIELSVLDGDNVSVSPDSPPKLFKELTVQLEYFNCLVLKNAHLNT